MDIDGYPDRRCQAPYQSQGCKDVLGVTISYCVWGKHKLHGLEKITTGKQKTFMGLHKRTGRAAKMMFVQPGNKTM